MLARCKTLTVLILVMVRLVDMQSADLCRQVLRIAKQNVHAGRGDAILRWHCGTNLLRNQREGGKDATVDAMLKSHTKLPKAPIGVWSRAQACPGVWQKSWEVLMLSWVWAAMVEDRLLVGNRWSLRDKDCWINKGRQRFFESVTVAVFVCQVVCLTCKRPYLHTRDSRGNRKQLVGHMPWRKDAYGPQRRKTNPGTISKDEDHNMTEPGIGLKVHNKRLYQWMKDNRIVWFGIQVEDSKRRPVVVEQMRRGRIHGRAWIEGGVVRVASVPSSWRDSPQLGNASRSKMCCR